jgi:hypothetical protein
MKPVLARALAGLAVGASLSILLAVAMPKGGSAVLTTIEGFESGNLSAYTFVASCSGPAVVGSPVHDGSFALSDAGSCWIFRNDAAVQVAQGDTLSAWVRFVGSTDGRAYFGFGASAAGTLSFVLAGNTGDILLQENLAYSFSDLNSSPQTFVADKWYRVQVEWAPGGSLTGRLFDSDGTTLLNTVSSNSNLFTSGGIAFRSFPHAVFDTIQRDVPATPTPTATSTGTATATPTATPPERERVNVGGAIGPAAVAAAGQAAENRERAAATAIQPAATVQPPRTGTGLTISPPSTGDAGLSDRASLAWESLAALAIGSALPLALRRRSPSASSG